MFKNRQSALHIWLFIVSLIIICASKQYAQFEGFSIHTDFFSINYPNGFNRNYYHPGNFLAGFQYNLPIDSDFEINSGIDFVYMEATGNIDHVPRQVEIFFPAIFIGFVYKFNDWGIFGKAGYSPEGTVNQHNNKEWIPITSGFDMYPVQIGLKYCIYKDLDLTTSIGSIFGKSIKIDYHRIGITTLNIGLSYNLFDSTPETLNADKSTENYKQMYREVLIENKELEKQNTDLKNHINEIVGQLNTKKTNDSLLSTPKLESISIDSINSVYNLHIGQQLSIRDFLNKSKISDAGILILGEYNSIATSFNGFPSGIWLICTVSDTSAFESNKNDFPRIDFRYDPGIQKSLVINIDVNKTEINNDIKLEIK